MTRYRNFKAGFSTRARVQALAGAITLATTLACEGSDGTPATNDPATNAAGSGGTPTGGAASAGAGSAQAGHPSAGATSSAGQSSTGGQTSSAGQTSGGQNPNGGQSMGGQTAGSGGAGSGGTGSGGAGACPHVQLQGSDICTIGDSWIQLQGNQVTTLENHMKDAGVIPQADHFDRREVSGSTLSAIITTYNNKPSTCKILVMDGGGIDLFTTAAGDQAAIDPVVKKFQDFLAKVKSDGYVQHIIYSLYPVIPSTRNLNVNMKPGFSAACAASAVDCHLVDLEPLFMGQHFASDNTHADTAGGVIIGDAWWKAMRDNCIAQ